MFVLFRFCFKSTTMSNKEDENIYNTIKGIYFFYH